MMVCPTRTYSTDLSWPRTKYRVEPKPISRREENTGAPVKEKFQKSINQKNIPVSWAGTWKKTEEAYWMMILGYDNKTNWTMWEMQQFRNMKNCDGSEVSFCYATKVILSYQSFRVTDSCLILLIWEHYHRLQTLSSSEYWLRARAWARIRAVYYVGPNKRLARNLWWGLFRKEE